MNKAYIDLIDDTSSNAILMYLSDNPSPINNLLGTKFPYGLCDKQQIWGHGYHHTNGDEVVVWFSDSIYSHDSLLEDLDMLGYTVVQLEETFHNFDDMKKYIEENQL